MSKFIKKMRYHSNFGFWLALMVHKVYIFINYRVKKDEYYIQKSFQKIFGYTMDFENPNTLNEKIQWYKLNFKHPLIVQSADKYEVREYIAKTIGEEYLIPLLFHTQDFKEIISENLPEVPFIIKANHTAGTHHIVRDKALVDWRKIQIDCHWWLHLNYYYMEKEWQYNTIKPRIVVEKLLVDDKGQVPSDYKMHYFDGKFEFLQVDLDRFTVHKRNIYDHDWNLLPFTWSILDKKGEPVWDNGRDVERPKNLELMIALGEKLAKPFPYVRVDFYILNEAIYFGELTFHHGGGLEHFTPNKWDAYFGQKVSLKKY
jgi:hypothetical protein